LRNVFQANSGKRRVQEILCRDQALVEHVDNAGNCHIEQNLRCPFQVHLTGWARKGCAIGEPVHLDVADQVGRTVQETFHEIRRAVAMSQPAQRIVGFSLPQIRIDGLHPVQWMPEKAAVE
jgi:hypothetical protein